MKRVVTSAVYIHNTLCKTSGLGNSLINDFNTSPQGLKFKQDLSNEIDIFNKNITFTQTGDLGND
jgi:hypothetical protein